MYNFLTFNFIIFNKYIDYIKKDLLKNYVFIFLIVN